MEKGLIYKHYKGGIYETICEACHTETNESFVVYKSLKDNQIWVRPTSMWNDELVYNGIKVKRFELEK